MNYVFTLSLVSIVVSAILTKLVIRFAYPIGLVSIPNHRSSHVDEIPHGGGIGFVFSYLFCLICLFVFQEIETIMLLVLLGGGTIIAAVGLLDDIRPVRARFRFIIQLSLIIAGYWLLAHHADISIDTMNLAHSTIGAILAVFLMVWWLNLFNFMDGIDGFAASEAVIILLSATLLIGLKHDAMFSDWSDQQVLMILLVFSIMGFLVFNWPPAQIFMGDVGSTFLGYLLAIIALATVLNGQLSIWIWLILGGVFWVDSSVTLITRILSGQKWYLAHHNHAYQLLARYLVKRHHLSRSGSHAALTVSTLVINLCWLLPLAWLSQNQPDLSLVLLLIAWLPLIILVVYLGAGKIERF